jgi:hypothetical protein
MIISVVNFATDSISDLDLQVAIRSVNRQIAYDFAPYWSLSAQLRLEGCSGTKPSKQSPVDMRGDAVIYLYDHATVKDALGYHDQNHRGVPYGFVFPSISKDAGENWTVTLSHEALELIADPEANLYVRGPHPTEPHNVFYWYEMCDPVQAETYTIDSVEVSNFVLPLYFTSSEERGGRNDFLNQAHQGKTLRSFGVNPGAYVGYFDPKTDKDVTFFAPDDAVADKRKRAKAQMEVAQRASRYRTKLAKSVEAH